MYMYTSICKKKHVYQFYDVTSRLAINISHDTASLEETATWIRGSAVVLSRVQPNVLVVLDQFSWSTGVSIMFM